MTTPGGVPNLPMGALTLDTLASKTQDTSGTAMKNRAVERFPGIMDLSTGLSPALDITPFGILTGIWAEVNSLIANADPADVTGPDDIPTLVLDFIEGLPFVGQFVELFQAILGTYTGTDTTLLGIQALFAPIRALVLLIPGLQQLLALVGINTGTSTTGSGSSTVGGNNPLGQALDQIWASIAQALSGQQAIQNSPGTTLIDDFATVGVSGYTPITGTLAVSGVGHYLQTPNLAVSYRTVGPSTNRHGSQIVIDGIQEGWCGTAICSDTAATSYALLQVYSGFEGDAVRLLTGSSPTVAVVQMQQDFITTRLANTNTFDIWYEDTTNTFHVLRNNQKVFDWPDVGTSSTDPANLVTHDASHRKVLLMTNGDDNPENGSYGPGISKHTEYDHT